MTPPGSSFSVRWSGDRSPRQGHYYCRGCGRTEDGSHVPAGWYTVHRAVGEGGTQRRLGLYCGLPCLIKAHRRLQAAEALHATHLGLPADDRSVPELLLDRALQYLIEDGLSIREAADLLQIPTAVLRSWLTTAGIPVNPHGALSTPAAHPPAQPPSQSIRAFLTTCVTPSPISVVHELRNAGHIRDATWDWEQRGPSHRPSITCTVTVTTTGATCIAAAATAGSKLKAKNEAATAIIRQLLAAVGDEIGAARLFELTLEHD